MIRQTSIQAYNDIKFNGLLSKRRWQVYDILFKEGALTGSELAVKFKKQYGVFAPSNTNVVTRLGELRDLGVAYEVKTTICSVTGMKVILWDVTSNLPLSMPKKKPKSPCPCCNGTGKMEN